MTKIIGFFLVTLLAGSPTMLTAAKDINTKVVPLPDLMNPLYIYSDAHQIYIMEAASIYIYNRKDFKLKKKFGRRGEGPKEFKVSQYGSIKLTVKTDVLEVFCNNKIYFYRKDGTYIKELMLSKNNVTYLLGDKFLAYRMIKSDNDLYAALTIFNAKWEKIKEIKRTESPFIFRKKWNLFSPVAYVVFYDNKFFISGEKGLEINGFNFDGEKVVSINQEYEKIKFTEKHKNAVIEWIKSVPSKMDMYKRYKNILWFPDYFPAIKDFLIADDRIYVQTFKNREENGSKFIIFTIKGKFVKNQFLPVINNSPLDSYPFTIQEAKIYQLIENIDTEEWELHFTDIMF
jgi:hypothetical protein